MKRSIRVGVERCDENYYDTRHAKGLSQYQLLALLWGGVHDGRKHTLRRCRVVLRLFDTPLLRGLLGVCNDGEFVGVLLHKLLELLMLNDAVQKLPAMAWHLKWPRSPVRT